MADADADLELVERDLDRPNVCGAVQLINGKQWICVLPVHNDPPRHRQRSPWQVGAPPR